MNFLHGYTEDGLKLNGVHYETENKEICVLLLHGMAGNIIDNYFGEVLGEKLNEAGISMIFCHNRGWGHISDFRTKEKGLVRVGAALEIFEDSILDIDLWIEAAKKLGYKKIILMGHSIGANKVIYYMSEKGNTEYIKSVILASPADMVGGLIAQEERYDDLIQEAKENVNNGKENKLLPFAEDDWYIMSSKTFLNTRQRHSISNNYPINDNPEKFEQLEKIKQPILAFYGSKENDRICNAESLEVLKEKATSSEKVTTEIIQTTGHSYKNKENHLAKLVINWIKEQ
jgi:alpha-beta hydrolase superfamily lysophospholipase